LLAGFIAVSLRVLTDGEIENAGVDIVSAVAEKLMPHPWDYIAVIAVMLSTVGTLETSILQFARTLFAMGRDNVLHPRYARLHRTYRTPWFATLLITALGLSLLFLSLFLAGIKAVISDSVNAVGFQISVYYSLAGLACARHSRQQARSVLALFVFLLACPLLGVGCSLFIAFCSVPPSDLPPTVPAIGGIAIGIVPSLGSRSRLARRTATSAAE